MPILAAVLACACGTKTIDVYTTPQSRGEAMVESAASLTASRFNAFACTTCHAKITAPEGKVLPGAPLAGAARRTTFWGGRFITLEDSVDECLTHFMRGKALDRTSAQAVDLYAYLASIADKGPTDAQPFTVVVAIDQTLIKGDVAHGAKLWSSTCASCHGDVHTGAGRLITPAGEPQASLIPEETINAHEEKDRRGVTIEKIRHGSFLGYAGTMPPFSRERLTDSDVADLVNYLYP